MAGKRGGPASSPAPAVRRSFMTGVASAIVLSVYSVYSVRSVFSAFRHLPVLLNIRVQE